MLPVNLNIENLSILLIGQGEKLAAREAKLRELGTKNLTIIKGPIHNLPEFNFDVVLVVGLSDQLSETVHFAAKSSGCLVNVEDNKKFCDFFFQSFVKRGDLLISVSTHGKTPGTAKIIRDKLEEQFPAEWANHIAEIATKRLEWKASGKTYDEVNELTKQYISNNKWL